MVDYEQLPNGYLEKRKKASLRLLYSFYLFLIYSLLMKYTSIFDFKVATYIYYGILGINVIFIMMSYTAKITFNNIPIPIYDEIKVFTKKEILIYSLLPIVTVPFILYNILTYIIVIVPFYIGVRVITRSVDDYDSRSSRRY